MEIKVSLSMHTVYEVLITCLETLTHTWFLSMKIIQMIIIINGKPLQIIINK